MISTNPWTRRFRRALASLGIWMLSAGTTAPLLRAATADDVPVLLPVQEKVLYLPISGESRSIKQIREKEIQAIQRFMRSRKLAEAPVVTAVDAPEVYLQVEPALAMEARDHACEGLLDTNPAELLQKGQELLNAGQVAEAQSALEAARTRLPCARNKLSRTQLAELLLWSGLATPNPSSDTAQAFLRAGVAADPLIVENPALPANAGGLLQKVAFDIEHSLPVVDVHLPQGEGDIWTHKNLMLDGRRIVFDKLFIQVTPGIHYLQINLPDDRAWGTFLEIKPATTPDLAELARESMGLSAQYHQQVQRVLGEGFASPAFLQGLKLYAVRMKRDYFFLAAITEEADGSWITVRRYHVDRGIEVPDLNRLPTEQGLTASVPLALFQPWAVDVSLMASNLSSQSIDYRSAGAGVALDAWYLLPRRLRAGLTLGLGARSYRLHETNGDPAALLSDWDLGAGAALGISLPLGSISLVPDIGYAAHLNRLRGVPMLCGSTPEVSDTSDQVYDCAFDASSEGDSLLFNLRGFAAGPRVRMGLELKPFSRGSITLRGLVRVGYSPLTLFLKDRVSLDVTTQDPTGNIDSETSILSIDENSRSWLVHELNISLGINGSY